MNLVEHLPLKRQMEQMGQIADLPDFVRFNQIFSKIEGRHHSLALLPENFLTLSFYRFLVSFFSILLEVHTVLSQFCHISVCVIEIIATQFSRPGDSSVHSLLRLDMNGRLKWLL